MAETLELSRTAKGGTLLSAASNFAMSSVGSKVLMALTGLFLWVFITGHLAGNLLLYFGAEAFNKYASTLHHNPALVWGVRLGMIIGFPLHIVTALRCAQINESARPTPYAYANKAPARTAALTMLLSGGTVLAFFAYHIAHFTLRAVGPMPTELLSTGDWNAAQMVVLGFQNPLISGFYIVGQLLLAMHLSHGLYSLFQHLGFWGSKWTPFLKAASQVVGYGMALAFASIPFSVYLGIIKP